MNKIIIFTIITLSVIDEKTINYDTGITEFITIAANDAM